MTESERAGMTEATPPLTQWSNVLAAGQQGTPQSTAALETLCRAYWPSLYAFVRRQGHSPADAQDLTQEFFAWFLAKGYVALADPARGRFRTFLLHSLKHFLISEWRKTGRQKRGGGQALMSWDAQAAEEDYANEPVDDMTPEKIYEKRWAVTLMDRVVKLLREEHTAAGNVALFEQLKDSIWGEKNPSSNAEIAAQVGMTEGAVKVSAHRLRCRCRDVLREQVAQTVARPEEIDEELRHLVMVLSG